MKMYKEKTVREMYWRGRSFDRVVYPERRPEENLVWNYRAEIFAFSRRLQENLSEDTLRKVFTHQDYVDSMKTKQAQLGLPDTNVISNSEFIARGYILLDECLKPYLRHNFDRLPEDGIEAITNYLKSEQVLADIAKWIGCKDIILTVEWPPNERVLTETVYAVLAGIENDLGLKRVRRFVVDMIATYLDDKDIFDDIWLLPNPKETLNLILSGNKLPSYEPRIIFQTGVKTIESCHVVGVYVNKKLLGSSSGETLAIAEECAVLDALKSLFDLKDDRAPLIYGEASETIDYDHHKKKHDDLASWKCEI